jgi:hypothetical protein
MGQGPSTHLNEEQRRASIQTMDAEMRRKFARGAALNCKTKDEKKKKKKKLKKKKKFKKLTTTVAPLVSFSSTRKRHSESGDSWRSENRQVAAVASRAAKGV